MNYINNNMHVILSLQFNTIFLKNGKIYNSIELYKPYQKNYVNKVFFF